MAELIKISELEEITSISDSNNLVVDNGTKTYKISVKNFEQTANASALAEANKAAASAVESASSASASADSASASSASVAEAKRQAESAKTYADSSKASATAAQTSLAQTKSYAESTAEIYNKAAIIGNAIDDNTMVNDAKAWAVGPSSKETAGTDTNNAKYYAGIAGASATQATESKNTAVTSASNAKTSETNAKKSETNASVSASSATDSAENAKASETSALSASATSATNASNAAQSAGAASNAATIARSYATGDTDTRDNEETTNAKYYAETASASAVSAKSSETSASASAVSAKSSETSASASATTAQSAASEAVALVSSASGQVAQNTSDITALSKDIAQNFQISTIQPTVTGDTVSLNDSAEYPIQELHLFGKSTQNGTPTPENPTVKVCGKNLAVPPSGKMLTQSGLTFSYDAVNNEFHFKGTYTSGNKVFTLSAPLNLPKNTTMSLSLSKVLESECIFGLTEQNVGNSVNIANRTTATFTDKYNSNGYLLYIPKAVSGDVFDLTFKVQVELGSVATEYSEPHTVQTASITATLSEGDSIVVNASEAYIKRADGTQEALPEDTATAIRALHTYNPDTRITADGAGVAVKYVADPTLYIDNKYAELASAIIASASEAE